MNHTTIKSLTDQSANHKFNKIKSKNAFSKFKRIFKTAKGDGFEEHELQALSNSFNKIEKRFDDGTPPNHFEQNQLAKSERMLNRAIVSNVITEYSNSSKRELLDAITTIESTDLEPLLNSISEMKSDNSQQGVNTINRIDTLANNLKSNQNELFTLLDQKINASNQADIIPVIETHGLNTSNKFNELSSKLDTIIGLVNKTPKNDPYADEYGQIEKKFFEFSYNRHAGNKIYSKEEVNWIDKSVNDFMEKLDLNDRSDSTLSDLKTVYYYRADGIMNAVTNPSVSLADADPYAAAYGKLEDIFFDARLDRSGPNKVYDQAEVDQYYSEYQTFNDSLGNVKPNSVEQQYFYRASGMLGAMTNPDDSMATEPSGGW